MPLGGAAGHGAVPESPPITIIVTPDLEHRMCGLVNQVLSNEKVFGTL